MCIRDRFYSTNEIIYVSCNPRTLCTDLKQFQEYGYEVKKVCIVDMFPFTNHCEVVVLMSKKQEFEFII